MKQYGRDGAASWIMVLGLAGVAAIAVLSFLPGNLAVETGMHSGLEHVLAYLVVGALAAAAVGDRLKRWLLLAALLGVAAVAEFIQVWIPGRTGSLRDFGFSAAGVLLGGLVLPTLLKTFAGIDLRQLARKRH